MRQRIALCMIAKEVDDNVIRALQSAELYVDHVFLQLNGPGGNPLGVSRLGEELKAVSVTVQYVPWEDDFALARNKNFAQVPQDEFDWIMWMDSDDTLEGGDELQDVLWEIADQDFNGVWLKYYYWSKEDGTPIIQQWRERIFRTPVQDHWIYAIHELVSSPPGAVWRQEERVVIRHHRENKDDQATRDRNRRILAKALAENPKEMRYLYYMANETYIEALRTEGDEQRANLMAALEAYKTFLENPTNEEDAYLANSAMADCYRLIGEYNAALDQDWQGVKIMPRRPAAYIGICKSFTSLQRWDDVDVWATACLEFTHDPDTTHAYDFTDRAFNVYSARALARANQGNMEGALEDIAKALEAEPDNEAMLELKQKIEEHQEAPPKVKKVVRRGDGKKHLAFVVPPGLEPWHPLLAEKDGIGGSETCVIELAHKFAERGWDTTIFATPGEHVGEYEGVDYQHIADWDPRDEYDVIISSRFPGLADSKPKSRVNLLWLHDVHPGPDGFVSAWGNRAAFFDSLVALTQWHAKHLRYLYPNQIGSMAVIGNGFHPELFEPRGERQKGRFIFSSSPDRGIDVLLEMWPRIQEMFTTVDPELHIFYGWDNIDKLIEMKHPGWWGLRLFKDGVMEAYDKLGGEQSGIFWHGRVSQERLGREMAASEYWAYPTYFMETYCLTAVQAQTAGVLPVCSNLAALTEVIVDPRARVDGWPNNESFKRDFIIRLGGVIHMPEDEKTRLRMATQQVTKMRTWDDAFQRWEALIDNKIRSKA